MRINSFKKYLKSLEEEDLREELLRLYSKLEEVRLFYKMDLGTDKDRQKIFAKAKKEIAKKYITKSYRRPRRPRIQKVNKLLSETRKATVLDYEMIDVYLFTCETAFNFMLEYNFYSDVLSNNICKTFEKACDLIEANLMQAEFKDRCDAIMALTRKNREIGFRIVDHYDRCFGEDEN